MPPPRLARQPTSDGRTPPPVVRLSNTSQSNMRLPHYNVTLAGPGPDRHGVVNARWHRRSPHPEAPHGARRCRSRTPAFWDETGRIGTASSGATVWTCCPGPAPRVCHRHLAVGAGSMPAPDARCGRQNRARLITMAVGSVRFGRSSEAARIRSVHSIVRRYRPASRSRCGGEDMAQVVSVSRVRPELPSAPRDPLRNRVQGGRGAMRGRQDCPSDPDWRWRRLAEGFQPSTTGSKSSPDHGG